MKVRTTTRSAWWKKRNKFSTKLLTMSDDNIITLAALTERHTMNKDLRNYVKRLMRLGYTRSEAVKIIRARQWGSLRNQVKYVMYERNCSRREAVEFFRWEEEQKRFGYQGPFIFFA